MEGVVVYFFWAIDDRLVAFSSFLFISDSGCSSVSDHKLFCWNMRNGPIYLLVIILYSCLAFRLASSDTLADPCQIHTDCEPCTQQPGCNWCWNGPSLGCRRVIDPLLCCRNCSVCKERVVFKAVSLGLLLGCFIILVSVIILSIVYSVYKFYWIRRHYFEVLA